MLTVYAGWILTARPERFIEKIKKCGEKIEKIIGI
jgi:hypothetical protein